MYNFLLSIKNTIKQICSFWAGLGKKYKKPYSFGLTINVF